MIKHTPEELDQKFDLLGIKFEADPVGAATMQYSYPETDENGIERIK